MNTDKYNPKAIRDAFRFLVDELSYSIAQGEVLLHNGRPYGFRLKYSGNNRRLDLYHDYKEDTFYFAIIPGLGTKYPNVDDSENIRLFWKLFQKFEPQLDFAMLQPINQTCAEAALLNSQLLKKYATNILLGTEWT